jgi:predicted acyl esterase
MKVARFSTPLVLASSHANISGGMRTGTRFMACMCLGCASHGTPRLCWAQPVCRKQMDEEEERQRVAMALQRQRERNEAARISAKARRDVETAQKLKAEREERLRAAEKLSAELLEQSKALALEWQRGSLVDQIQSIRPRPATTYGSWSTGDLQGLLASLNAARERLGRAKWSQLAGAR